MAGKIWVGLRPGNSVFRRCVRNNKGKITKTIEFHPGIPVALTNKEAQVCADAIGATLLLVTPSEDPDKFLVDKEGTEDALFGIAMDRKEKGLDLAPHQQACLDRVEVAEQLAEDEVEKEFDDVESQDDDQSQDDESGASSEDEGQE